MYLSFLQAALADSYKARLVYFPVAEATIE